MVKVNIFDHLAALIFWENLAPRIHMEANRHQNSHSTTLADQGHPLHGNTHSNGIGPLTGQCTATPQKLLRKAGSVEGCWHEGGYV